MVFGDGGEKTVQSELTTGTKHGKHTHTQLNSVGENWEWWPSAQSEINV